MKITNATLVRLVKEEIKNLFKEADNNRTWLRNLSLAPPTSMAALRKGQSIAPGSSSSDRYPHFRHVNQAISLLYQDRCRSSLWMIGTQKVRDQNCHVAP